jgi:hypothetical protein
MDAPPQVSAAAFYSGQVQLVTQTGIPPTYPARSKEVIYDALEAEPTFKLNPFGPQLLILARAQYRW